MSTEETPSAEEELASSLVGPPVPDVPKRNRSSRSGRASRRRRRKLRDIQHAEEAIRQGRSIQLPETSTALPSDRNQTWPAVYERRTFHKWSPEDERALVGQLGYLPGNVIHIASRVGDVPCLKHLGNNPDEREPVVVQLYPLVMRQECDGSKSDGRRFKSRKRKLQAKKNSSTSNGVTTELIDDDKGNDINQKSLIEPFPTMYWLTHQMLRILVSKLELEAFGIQLERRLAEDPKAMASMERAHRAYGKQRYELLTESDLALVRECQWEAAFCSETRGVAGIRNPAAVKCLHAHVAHVLSGGSGSADNVVGKWVLEAVQGMLQNNDSNEDGRD